MKWPVSPNTCLDGHAYRVLLVHPDSRVLVLHRGAISSRGSEVREGFPAAPQWILTLTVT